MEEDDEASYPRNEIDPSGSDVAKRAMPGR